MIRYAIHITAFRFQASWHDVIPHCLTYLCTSFSTGLRAYLRMSRVLERRSFCNDRFDTVFSLQIPSLGLHANLTENAKCAFTLSYVLRAACRR